MRDRKEDSQRNTVVPRDFEWAHKSRSSFNETQSSVGSGSSSILTPPSCEATSLIVSQSRSPRSEQSSLRILAGCRRIHSHFVPIGAAERAMLDNGGRESRRETSRYKKRVVPNLLKVHRLRGAAMFHD